MGKQLRIVEVTEETEDAWRQIHNTIIPASPLSAEEISERRQVNLLTLAYAGEDLVGNATVRSPTDNSDTRTVIVKILPEYRNRGYGTEYLAQMLEVARQLGSQRIETVVLVANVDGMRFAVGNWFCEIDRYVVDGAEYVDLALLPVDPRE
ncbi:GNAT family N-acetyltransferase [Nocardioides marmorisolisilvae]|uniref:GNAT family N-acetyltransferase n=1 Tax=Nocardioides marmorisolisilvae TaxID=1542737 RepID=UPI0016095D57|nr:GNAT family N-acetyltransferase [Nocardioides marmorisolisilvae]